jgi:hypothetical protein
VANTSEDRLESTEVAWVVLEYAESVVRDAAEPIGLNAWETWWLLIQTMREAAEHAKEVGVDTFEPKATAVPKG